MQEEEISFENLTEEQSVALAGEFAKDILDTFVELESISETIALTGIMLALQYIVPTRNYLIKSALAETVLRLSKIAADVYGDEEDVRNYSKEISTMINDLRRSYGIKE